MKRRGFRTSKLLPVYTDEMLYNNAKCGFVYDLYEKIFAADPNHQHDARARQ